ncbi:DUF4236 domain-containing protein [Zavarzinia sp. CC-PAN008]|uniref:DUF4236 domain-containing protein n=1 Tax=Zavarzinia sp. CC-PAN008 TaxID=3243332 RepID=UPI003F746093
MGLRFQKSIRILPGVRLNLSKSGISLSLGRPGATLNVGHGRTRTSLGLPGTGVSYQTQGKSRWVSWLQKKLGL